MRYIAAVIIAGLMVAGAALFSWWNYDVVDGLFRESKRHVEERQLPVTVHVVDAQTEKTIPEFHYQCRIRTAGDGRRVEKEDWRIHKSAVKALELQVPISCQVILDIKAREYQGGYYRTQHTFDVKTTDKDRKLIVKMQRGITIKGTVRDARTKRPVQGAEVMPYQPTCPSFRQPDAERVVLTDENGMFTLPGVTPAVGVFVTHSDYVDGTIEISKETDENPTKAIEDKEVLLDPGQVIEGKVTAPDGQPLDNVEVSCGLFRRVLTDKNGAFVMRGLSEGRKTIYLKKKGYVKTSLNLVDKAPPQKLVLQPLYQLRGRVLTLEGEPVRRFFVIAGPGRNPPAYSCTEAKINNGENGFVLHLESTGTHWVGVRAEGHAVWEGWTEVARDMDALAIALKPGVDVAGKVELPTGTVGDQEAALTPQRPDGSTLVVCRTPARDVATLRTAVKADGTFIFEHVRPDVYVLTLSGKHVTERAEPLRVTDARTDVGLITVQSAGRIVGQVFHGEWGSPWSFAEGEIRPVRDAVQHQDPITFTADEDGRFEVDGVPAGDHQVSIPYQLNDIIMADTRDVQVLAGRTSGVSFSAATGPNGMVRQNVARLLARSWYVWAPAVLLACFVVAAVLRRRSNETEHGAPL